jgi:hypothetical protein
MNDLHLQAPARTIGITRPLALGLAVLAGVIRLVPHPWNITPVGALCLFGGARLASWQAFAIPLTVMAASDLAIYYLRGDPVIDPFVYGSFLLNIVLGRWLLRHTESPWRIGAVSVLGTVQFFLVTNFGAWLTLSQPPHLTYSPTLAGLVQSYLMGLAFVRSTSLGDLAFVGDLFFCGVLFGLHALLTRWVFTGERVTPLRPEATP